MAHAGKPHHRGVHDGKEGSERIKLYPYELVVLDWGLPGLPGLKYCRSYRAAGGTTPILMLTGKSDITQRPMDSTLELMII